MCFSASASFVSGGLLLGVGALTVPAARARAELPFAAIPLLFAVQQLSEGVIWWTYAHEAPRLQAAMTQFYSFFSHVLWPVYVPLAVLLLEPPGWRRVVMRGIAAAGLAVGAYLLYAMFAYPITARATGNHVEYVSPHFYAALTMSAYLLATTGSMLVSSQRVVKVFGALALIAFVLAYEIYTTWFISVWCFFAALLSVVVAFRFLGRQTAAPLAP